MCLCFGCTDVHSTFSCSEIAHEDEIKLVKGQNLFSWEVLAEFLFFFHGIRKNCTDFKMTPNVYKVDVLIVLPKGMYCNMKYGEL